MIQVNMHEAKSDLSRLVEKALGGEDVVIARNGRPAVRLVPVRRERPAPGLARGAVSWAADAFDPLSDEEINELFTK